MSHQAQARRAAALRAIADAIGEPAADVDLVADPLAVVLVRGERITGEREEKALRAMEGWIDGSPR